MFVLTVWFHTEAFEEYGRIFGLGKLLRIGDYKQAVKNDLSIISYRMFLAMEYKNFWTRLINCSFCLGFWVVLVTCLCFSFYNIPLIYVVTMLIFLLQSVLIKYS
jgi:hypothetical protein